MADVTANLPVALEEESAPAGPQDEALTKEELGCLGIVAALKKAPAFDKFPGTTFLRKGAPGRVICEQGDKGSTAFYVLTAADVVAVRKKQIQIIQEVLDSDADRRKTRHPRFGTLSNAELADLQSDFADEVAQVEQELALRAAMSPEQCKQACRALTVHLLTEEEQQRIRRRAWYRWWDRLRAAQKSGPTTRRTVIPKDAPVDADDFLYEGDLLGEMSCLNRAPRSATVVATWDCYLLEMLRNVLDQVRRDPVQKQQMDEKYRERVLLNHLQQLSFFEGVAAGPNGLGRLRDDAELVMYEPGDVVFEEHDPSDAIYVVRSGMIKVVKNVGCQLRSSELNADQFIELCGGLAEQEATDSTLGKLVWQGLSAGAKNGVAAILQRESAGKDEPKRLHDELRQFLQGESVSQALFSHVLDGLNQFIRDGAVHQKLGKTTEEVLREVRTRALEAFAQGVPEKTESWSQLERWVFHRLLLEAVLGAAMPSRATTNPPMLTLAYEGPGTVFGEMGVFLDAPRSATCIAYDHPDGKHSMRVPDSRTGARPSQLELVKIPRATFRALINDFPALRDRVEQIVRKRQPRSRQRRRIATGARVDMKGTPEFEELGLIQGQKLMLIDLDRCTRCGECVKACVAAHDDGNTRLYLDGPRFGNYLVPLTCRKCLDPVCMIGCPVGSINRGDNGEIVIRDWCIGCSMCADQCPYGSIQMTPREKTFELTDRQRSMLGEGVSLREVTDKAVVCDLCSSLSTGPACVYACPHDAALRENASLFFAHE